jgi:hypothetical protein
MNTNKIAELLGERPMRYTSQSWITNDGIEVTEGIKSGGKPLIMIECRECGAHAWTTAANAAMKLDQIRVEYHGKN